MDRKSPAFDPTTGRMEEMNMFSNAVKLICEKHFDYKCFGCPLLAICDIPTQEQPGETLEEKPAWWETQMNKAAEEVPPA